MWMQQETGQGSGLTWTCVEAPSRAEQDRLVEELGVDREFVDHSLDVDEVARVERNGTDTLVVLRVPRRMPLDARIPTTAVALGIIMRPGQIVTISAHGLDIIEALQQRLGKLRTHSHHRVMLTLVLVVAERFLEEVRYINGQVERVEERLTESQENREVVELMRLQKSLVHLTTGLRSNQLVMDRLERDAVFKVADADQDLVEDARIELRQAFEMTTIAENILEQMMDAFASVISNNLNGVMKRMTSFMIVMMMPGLVASFYGMNVALPMGKDPGAFVALLVVSALLTAVVAVALRKRKMF